MKTPHKILILAGLATSIAATASAAGTSTAGTSTVLNAQQQVGNELTLTKDSISQLLAKIQEARQTAGTLDEADYLDKLPAYESRISQATAVFQDALGNAHNGILVQLQALMARYNAVYESKQYPDDVRSNLLTAQRNVLTEFATNLSSRYQAEVLQLFQATGLPIADKGAAIQNQRHDAGTGVEVYAFLSQGCYSRSCISQSAMDEVNYVSLVKSLFNRTLTFQLEDGFQLTLSGVTDIARNGNAADWTYDNGYYTYDSVGLDAALSWTMYEVARIEDYPASYNSLPSGVDDATLAQLKAQAQNQPQPQPQPEPQPAPQPQDQPQPVKKPGRSGD